MVLSSSSFLQERQRQTATFSDPAASFASADLARSFLMTVASARFLLASTVCAVEIGATSSTGIVFGPTDTLQLIKERRSA